MKPFKVVAPFAPSGDQGAAGPIQSLAEAASSGEKYMTLKGVTGSGKTFTMAKVIEKLQKPALIISHNKTLSAQLYREFKGFFPDNAVEYFVSYYDYYQPGSLRPLEGPLHREGLEHQRRDRPHEAIGHERRLWSAATSSSSPPLSCIYGLGSPDLYREMRIYLDKGKVIDLETVKRNLVNLQYERNDMILERGKFRVRGDLLEIYPAYLEEAYRIELDFDTVARIRKFDPLTGKAGDDLDEAVVYPAKHFVMPENQVHKAGRADPRGSGGAVRALHGAEQAHRGAKDQIAHRIRPGDDGGRWATAPASRTTRLRFRAGPPASAPAS